MRRDTADLMLLATICLWALNFTATKYVLTHGLAPFAFAAPRYAIAAGIFVVLALVLERSLRVGGRDGALLAGAAVVLFLNQIGFVYSLEFSTASTVALVFGTMPIFTGVVAMLTGVERPTTRFAVAAAISLAGAVLVATGSSGGLSANLKGDALALLASATWGAYTVAIAPLMTRYSPYRISAWVLTMTTILLAIAGTGQLAREDYPGAWQVWGVFAFAVLGPLVITNVLWFTAIDEVGPSRASLFANLQFFLAALFGVILLSESLTAVQLVGGAAVGAAILLSRFRGAPTPQPVE